MRLSLKELTHLPTAITGGHRLCPGCAEPLIVRHVLMGAGNRPVIATNATGCLEVSTTIFPYTAWNIPWMHLAFENAAAAIAGIEAMYQQWRRKGLIDPDTRYGLVAFAGDGGTYDIGFQALSGMAERWHDCVFVCLNNEAYMNTGVQRSSATPLGCNTTTSPAGSVIPGKPVHRKDLTLCMAAHDIPYVAQVAPMPPPQWRVIIEAAQKAFDYEGPAFLNVLSPCPLGWISEPAQTPALAKLAADTCIWPLYEVDHGQFKLLYKPKEKLPIEQYLEPQGRFRHLFRDERGAEIRKRLQEWVDYKWHQLLKLCGEE
ncbi:MAG: pyruvate ferredoxin oxidoreductase [Armatimonadetes bacterium]|nr:pyruvate ferredoxin oxidoreductase [Armatimonadota bacterium]